MDDCISCIEVSLGVYTVVSIERSVLQIVWSRIRKGRGGREERREKGGEERGEKRNLWIQNSKYWDTVGRVWAKGEVAKVVEREVIKGEWREEEKDRKKERKKEEIETKEQK